MHVIFRMWRDTGDCLALFPDQPADRAGHCWSYEHLGQGGAANYNLVIRLTRPAQPGEFEELADELTQLGYQLTVRKRRPASRRRTRA